MGNCSDNEPFALQVTDDSMSPEFPQGCIIIVEPGGVIEDASYVIADCGDELFFRQLKMIDGKWELQALQQGHNTIPVPDLSWIKGRVVQRAGRRRREHKSYI